MNDETIAAPAAAKTLEVTAQLRWCHCMEYTDPPTLQQAWVVRETGEIEWRDVPHALAVPR